MKTISAHVTGFYHSSFHAYTTEVNVDGHRWRLGLRYSKFHDFYVQLEAIESDFAADFPPKGTLFFKPKPEERQEQLEVFLQQVLAYYAFKGYPSELEELLCDLLKVPRHLRFLDREDDDASTSTESGPDEIIPDPPSSSDSASSLNEADLIEEDKPPIAELEKLHKVEEKQISSGIKNEETVLSTQVASGATKEILIAEKRDEAVSQDEAETVAERLTEVEDIEEAKQILIAEKQDDAMSQDEAETIAERTIVAENVSETKEVCMAEELDHEVAQDEAETTVERIVEAETIVETENVDETVKTRLAEEQDDASAEEEVEAIVETILEANIMKEVEKMAENDIAAIDIVEMTMESVIATVEMQQETFETDIAVKAAAPEEDIEPILAVPSINEPLVETTIETAVAAADELIEEHVAEAVIDTSEVDEDPEASSMEEQDAGPTAVKSIESQDAKERTASETSPSNDQVEPIKLATSCFCLNSYLPEPWVEFLQRRCMNKTNIVILCVALILPLVFARR
ncbi:hypothetical protein CCR75_007207 [Bremia lactucae]|uniref:PX domain-containing protein n=1 Tax=Bremia lactucae TaxID=4779 RepID=A0A976FJ59_BRELC|nr:hypothetical protein CCR75_007207 [Bremia lactucae]